MVAFNQRATKKGKSSTSSRTSKKKAKTKAGKSKSRVRAGGKRARKLKKVLRPLDLERYPHNPIIEPSSTSYWESEAVFNPGAVVHGERIHLFYRALGPDGVSRIGYASSKDGIHFDKRYPHPVYVPENIAEAAAHRPFTSPARLKYDTGLYASGGGWGGCEDPRAVKIGERIYLTFNLFSGWHSIRVGLTSISEDDLERGRWNWRRFIFLSPPNQRHKNWVLFPEKINGRYALFHNLYDKDPQRVKIEFIDNIEEGPISSIDSPDPQLVPDRNIAWHHRTRSIGPPPVKTKYGWLVFYHAMDKKDPGRYKLGAMMLDIKDPRKVIYRSHYPILEPDMWYENDWKPGIIYASGAVTIGDTLFIYYGGGDKHIGVAYTKLSDFVDKLMKNEHAVFSIKSTRVR